VKDAASETERKKFEILAKHFQTYGMQYDVDWVLMSAQGYQESKLNPNAKSRVGAIGIMQVLPATGNEMHVGDIRQTEANINAGIKYMRMMIDRYYAREPMTEMDKALFTFASYNAGPARVRQLRQEARQRGLDPNVWFGNVEYIAAERVGAETVTYVSNIYKYYIAYRLIMDSKAARQQELRQGKDRRQLKNLAAPDKRSVGRTNIKAAVSPLVRPLRREFCGPRRFRPRVRNAQAHPWQESVPR
jgi:membrane-bound lytic murein transglycosylase MltF